MSTRKSYMSIRSAVFQKGLLCNCARSLDSFKTPQHRGSRWRSNWIGEAWLWPEAHRPTMNCHYTFRGWMSSLRWANYPSNPTASRRLYDGPAKRDVRQNFTADQTDRRGRRQTFDQKVRNILHWGFICWLSNCEYWILSQELNTANEKNYIYILDDSIIL